jgi:hypothetical protein
MAVHILIEVKVRLDDGPYMMLVTGKQMSGTEFPENCPYPEIRRRKRAKLRNQAGIGAFEWRTSGCFGRRSEGS